MKIFYRMSDHSGSLCALLDFPCSPETSQTAPPLLPGCHLAILVLSLSLCTAWCFPAMLKTFAVPSVSSTMDFLVYVTFQTPAGTIKIFFFGTAIQLQAHLSSVRCYPVSLMPAYISVFTSDSHFNCKPSGWRLNFQFSYYSYKNLAMTIHPFGF